MELLEGKMPGTSRLISVSTKLQRIAELARQTPPMVFTTLAHHIDVDFLREAYRRTRKDAAVGVDHQSADEYASRLDENLSSLLDRFHSGQYFAPPVRRVHIPKADGKTRPIGVPTFEDKVLQRAVAMILEAVYEQDFLDCSYGFRPRRSAHQALDTLWNRLMDVGGGWVLEVDIQRFFDTLNHQDLRRILDQRVRDGVLRRAIDKWLNAGVLEAGEVTRPAEGTPQGGVISPLLANIYLHEVLDRWFESDVEPRLEGAAFLIRYADDFVIIFAQERDARRVLDVLPKRFGKYGLALHPEKTRLIEFRRPPRGAQRPRGDRPVTFDLLGFTHHWGLSRRGTWVVARRTSRHRFTRAIRAIAEWCRRARHLPIAEQSKMLGRKLRGHFSYYGVQGNSRALARFSHETRRVWRKWLKRRGKRRMTWETFAAVCERYPLPTPYIVHWTTPRTP
jgi:RNA-directed DNA polymerase